MTASGVAILTNPHRCGHIVYPYTDDTQMVEAVSIFTAAGFEVDDAVVLIATEAHCEAITQRLEQDGFDVKGLRRTDQFISLIASDVLSRFMVGGMPDPVLFEETIAVILQRAKRSMRAGRERRVRLFGEMVSLLWRVDVAGAALLEDLWNQVIEKNSVALLCAYALDGESHCELPDSLRNAHQHCLASA